MIRIRSIKKRSDAIAAGGVFMKKVVSIILSAIIMLSAFALGVSADAEKNIFVGNGINCTIMIPADAAETEKYAAQTLQKYIKEITGIELAVSASSDAPSGKTICISTADGGESGSYTVKADGNTLYITGSGSRGPIYGVFGFLKKYCNCRWYTQDVTAIPKSDTVAVPDGENFEYTPFFESTETDWISPRNSEFSLANGLSGGTYRSLSPAQGGTVNYISGLAHTLTDQFCSKNKYFEVHPEYFALRDGKRISDQLCLTNPDVLEIVTREVLDLIKAKHDPSQALQIVSLTQADNGNYCTCEKCAALDKENGSQAGTMVTFANAVAREVKKAGYDNIAIDTFAYQYTRHTPSKVVPEDNVIIRICSIECCFGHALSDPGCKENVSFMEDLEGWSRICGRIHIWDYSTNYAFTANIFPDFGVLQKNMQMFYEHNVKGVYEEGAYYMNECNGEFGDLRSYLLSVLMQDPYLDYDAEMNGFLEAFYGSGWKNIREFIDITTEHAVSGITHLGITQKPEKSLPGLSLSKIIHCDELWADAKATAGSETYLDRIRRSELCWRYWKCCNRKQEFSIFRPLHTKMAAREELYNDYNDFGFKRLGEYPSRVISDCGSLYLLRPATKWVILYDESYWDFLEPYIVGFYEFIVRLFG